MGAFITPGGLAGVGAAVTWPLLAGVDGTPTSPAYSWGADTDIGIRRGGADNLRLVTAGVDRLVIDSAGNVGIGTTLPGQKLEVAGIIKVGGEGGSSFSLTSKGISFFQGDDQYKIGFDSVGGTKGYIRYNVPESTDTWGHIFSSGNPGSQVDRMFIGASGNVGIGTTEPTEKLDIRGNYLKIKNNADASGGIVFDVGSTSAQIVQYIFRDRGADKFYQRKNLANDLDFIDASGNTSLYLKQGGNVGIGTTGPGTTLDVRKNISGAVSYPLFIRNEVDAVSTGVGMSFRVAPDAEIAKIEAQRIDAAYHASELRFYTRQAGTGSIDQRMVIDKNGNVGIGTATPGYKLHVVGSIKYTGSLVSGDIQFANKVRITEEGMSLVFENPLGERIAKLDSWGNLIIKGKVFEKMEV